LAFIVRALSARNYKSVPGERKLVSQLQEVAFKALKTEKPLVFFPDQKGLDFLNLRRRLLTAKLTGAGPNVTILKLLQSASIDKV